MEFLDVDLGGQYQDSDGSLSSAVIVTEKAATYLGDKTEM
jgi:hypothetical protein